MIDAAGLAITAPGDTCATAPTITISALPATVPLLNQSTAGLKDDYPPFVFGSLGTCSSGVDGVYRLDLKVAANVGFSGRADFTGSIVVGSGCPVSTMNMCSTLGGGSNTNSFNAGTLYIVVERQS